MIIGNKPLLKYNYIYRHMELKYIEHQGFSKTMFILEMESTREVLEQVHGAR